MTPPIPLSVHVFLLLLNLGCIAFVLLVYRQTRHPLWPWGSAALIFATLNMVIQSTVIYLRLT